MRTTTTKSFTIALVLTTLLTAPLTAPLFAANRDDAKRERGDGNQQQQTIVQRLTNQIVRIFDSIILPHP